MNKNRINRAIGMQNIMSNDFMMQIKKSLKMREMKI